MSFSEQLRVDAHEIFEAIKRHPFITGIAESTLTSAQLSHYVQQDYQYLTTYVRLYGLALAKCSNRHEMRDLHARIGFVLNEEVHPHLNFCRVANVSYESLQGEAVRLAPTAHHYAQHMLAVAGGGTLGEIIAALLPCHWTYVEIAQYLDDCVHPTATHPFYEWISFYNSDSMKTGLVDLRAWLDTYATDAGCAEKARMRSAFVDSCHLELRFFEMAYTVERW